MIDIKQVPVLNYYSGHDGRQVQWIIIHATAGGTDAEAIARYFKTTEGTNKAASSHFIVGQNGQIVQCIAETNSAWGNGFLSTGHAEWWDPAINPNYVTFSIEFVKEAIDNSNNITIEQEQSGFELIKYLCDKYSIPKRAADATGGITGHFSIDPINRSRCPGPFPWTKLFQYLMKGVNSMIIPDGWTDVKKVLRGIPPFNAPIVLGFRDYVLQYPGGWQRANGAMLPEYRAEPFEFHNPLFGAGQQQPFRWNVLAWKNGAVVEQAIGEEYVWLRREYLNVREQYYRIKAELDAYMLLHPDNGDSILQKYNQALSEIEQSIRKARQ